MLPACSYGTTMMGWMLPTLQLWYNYDGINAVSLQLWYNYDGMNAASPAWVDDVLFSFMADNQYLLNTFNN